MELSSRLDLILTPQNNNTWLIEIRTKSLRSGSGDIDYSKILNLGFLVDENLARGEYQIELSDIDFETNEGLRVVGPNAFVPVHVERFGTPIYALSKSTIVFVESGNLVIDTPVSEKISIYSVGGILIYQGEKQAGRKIVPLSASHRYLVVQGNSGWVRKVIR